jgi:hypothetical protein
MQRVTGVAAVILAVGLSLVCDIARADDLFGGMYGHAVLEAHGREDDSFDTMVGYRTNPLPFLSWIFKPQLHVMVSINDRYPDDFAAVGFDWRIRFSERWYFRPGIGLAYNTGKANIPAVYGPGVSPAQSLINLHEYETRIAYGDHYLFEPELAFGYNISPKISLEASYVHLSNGQILHQGKNEGVDDAGLRLNYHFR